MTCADLECGRINACADGIIASCADGKTVKWHVCQENASDICGEEWQVKNQYKCDEYDIECDGCRPERTSGCAAFAQGGAGGTGGSGGGGGGTGAN